MLDELFLAALSRLPSATEKEKALGELLNVPEADRRAALEDVFWCVLTCKEFVFNR
jgi:hypothetical protein